jgi:hypothetical protein
MKNVTPEKLQGMRAGLRDADGAISAFVRDNYAELRDAANEEALAAARRVDDALAELEAAHAERAAVSQRQAGLLRLAVYRQRPGTIPSERPEVEQAAQGARRATMLGGSRPPLLPEHFAPEPVVMAPMPGAL